MTGSKSYQEYLIGALADPLEAADYLNVALEDGVKELFLLALRNVAEARLGGTGFCMHSDSSLQSKQTVMPPEGSEFEALGIVSLPINSRCAECTPP